MFVKKPLVSQIKRINFGLCSTLLAVGAAGLVGPVNAADERNETFQLEEIVVTARFRDETAQDVGVSMSVMGAKALERANVASFEDIAQMTPGLENLSRGPGKNLPTIRGTASTNSNLDLVAQPGLNSVFYDEVALKFIRSSNPELPLYDLQRVEVLKGPQPTYFGEGAVGGSVRFFTQDPDLQSIQARVRAEGSRTDDGDDPNFVLDGSVSVPIIEDKMGLRLTAFQEERGGFIDNVADGVKTANDYENSGFSAVLLYQPNEDFTWRLSGYSAEQEYGFRQSVNGNVDDLENTTPGPDSREDSTVLISNKLSWTLNNFTLESVTGYVDRDYSQQFLDARSSFRSLPAFGITDGVVISNLDLTDETWSQEFRVMTTFDSWVNFVGGILYVDSESTTVADNRTDSALYQAFLGTDLFISGDLTYEGEQLSVFGELQFSFMDDALRVAVGARYFDQEYITPVDTPISVVPVLALRGASPVFDAATLGADELGGSVDAILPRVQAEYDISENMMVYASAAKGARNGLYNAPSSVLLQGFTAADPEFNELFLFEEDTLWSYELGLKSEFLEGTLRANFSLYYTDWKDMQVSRIVGAFPLVGNLADSTIKGLEWDVYWAINENFSVFTNGSVQEAEFTEDIPLLVDAGSVLATAPSGTRIPQTAELSYTLGAEGRYPELMNSIDLVGSVSYSYLDDRLNILEAGKLDQKVPELELVNARIGLESENWSLFLYANNLFNEIEPTFINDIGIGNEQSINTPRTVGLTYRFDF